MNRLNWFVVVFSVCVLAANLLLVRPHEDSFAPDPEAAPVVHRPQPARAPAASPFAYIHEDGSEEYLPSGLSAEDTHAGNGFRRVQSPDPRAAVYSWSSAEEGPPVSLAAIAEAIRNSLKP